MGRSHISAYLPAIDDPHSWPLCPLCNIRHFCLVSYEQGQSAVSDWCRLGLVHMWMLGLSQQSRWCFRPHSCKHLASCTKGVWEGQKGVVSPSLDSQQNQSAAELSRSGGVGKQGSSATKAEPPVRQMGSFRSGSLKYLTSWGEGGLGKCLLALSAQEKSPSNPQPSTHFLLMANLSN